MKFLFVPFLVSRWHMRYTKTIIESVPRFAGVIKRLPRVTQLALSYITLLLPFSLSARSDFVERQTSRKVARVQFQWDTRCVELRIRDATYTRARIPLSHHLLSIAPSPIAYMHPRMCVCVRTNRAEARAEKRGRAGCPAKGQ